MRNQSAREVLTDMIEQTHINIMELIPTQLKKVASTNGGEFAGPCPMCGGKDRFRVHPHAKPNARWFCRQCSPKGGDAIGFIMAYRGVDFKQACEELNLHLSGEYRPPERKRDPQPTLDYARIRETGSDGERWQERAHKFIDYAEEMMWSQDATGRDYLYQRGFSDWIINLYRLGYCPQNLRDDWGLENKVWLPRGIVIPYEVGEYARITKIRIRRLDWHQEDSYDKYISPAGVQNTAFLTRPLLPGDLAVMVESEMDAMVLKLAVPEPNVVGMATGGTNGARQLQYMAKLSLASKVLIAFDDDNNGAGAIASKYWMDALPNAIRKIPTQHDINDMWLADDDIYQWVYS